MVIKNIGKENWKSENKLFLLLFQKLPGGIIVLYYIIRKMYYLKLKFSVNKKYVFLNILI